MRRDYVPLYAAVSTSEKLATLGSDSARLFYTWLLPQCDSWGRIEGSPRVLGAKVWPMLGHSVEETSAAVADCVRVGLLEIRTATGTLGQPCEPWIQVPDWDDKAGKVGQLARDRGESKFPSPDASRAVSDTEPRPTQAKPSQSRAEESREEENPPAPHVGDAPPAAARGTRKRGSKSGQEDQDVFHGTPEIDTPAVRDALESYLAFRRKKHWDKLLPESIAGTLKELEPLGPEGVVAAYRQSITKGWKGVFAVKAVEHVNGSAKKNGSRFIPDKSPQERARDRAENEAWNEWRVKHPERRPSSSEIEGLIAQRMGVTV